MVPEMAINVAGWLRQLGLEQYAPAFRENHINAAVLPELTADDLIGLGVTSIGHRRQLLVAIATLREDHASSGTPIAVTEPPRRHESADTGAGSAERRQLTVMFCDIVGSTALSTQFDPEDLRDLIGAYHRSVAETVERFTGFVARYMGDGVLVYFGYPFAHEDDAEQAVRAGLAVIDAVAGLSGRVPLRVRIGVATGLAVVGDLIGEGTSQERGVVGETPNLAARMQGLAEPDTLVIADATRRQVGGLFEPARLLAGFAEPQHAWRVLGESATVSRFEALRAGTTPLVGRDEEIELLFRRWAQAKSGEGRVGTDLWRAGHRQVTAHGGAVRARRNRSSHAPAIFLLAASPGQRAPSCHRPTRTCRRVRPRRHGRSQARQTPGAARTRHAQ